MRRPFYLTIIDKYKDRVPFYQNVSFVIAPLTKPAPSAIIALRLLRLFISCYTAKARVAAYAAAVVARGATAVARVRPA